MASFFETFRTIIENGIVQGDSQLVTMALYGATETIDPSDGAALRIIDDNGNGLIDPREFADATVNQGIGLNLGGDQLLFDGEPPLNDMTGRLYSPAPVADGTDVSTYIDELEKNFSPVAPESVETQNSSQTPGTDPTDSVPLCFTRGTRILTPGGLRRVEELRAGDLVTTQDNGAQPIRWIGGSRLHPSALAQRETLRPVRIRAGALGEGYPERTLVVSRQHRMLIRSRIAERVFGFKEVLVPAHMLTELPGITLCGASRPVEYYHLLLDRHEIVFAEGAPTETLLTGTQAMEAMSPRNRAEIRSALLAATGAETHAGSARPLATGHKARRMVERHRCNQKPVFLARSESPAMKRALG